jgi:hypothetical protein
VQFPTDLQRITDRILHMRTLIQVNKCLRVRRALSVAGKEFWSLESLEIFSRGLSALSCGVTVMLNRIE